MPTPIEEVGKCFSTNKNENFEQNQHLERAFSNTISASCLIPENDVIGLKNSLDAELEGKGKDQLEKEPLQHKSEGLFTCKFCGRGFAKQNFMKSHEIVHKRIIISKLEEKCHECIYCSKLFARRHDKLRHERTVHALEKSLSCATCNKLFTDIEELGNHCNTNNHILPEKKSLLKVRKKTRKIDLKPERSQMVSTIKIKAVDILSADAAWNIEIEKEINNLKNIDLVTDSWPNPNIFRQNNGESIELNDQMEVYPNQQQTYVVPIIHPTYTRYQELQVNSVQSALIDDFTVKEPAFFQPNMNQVGYQMTANVPIVYQSQKNTAKSGLKLPRDNF
jgi:hypothetical protein